jgi:hypothetical protein
MNLLRVKLADLSYDGTIFTTASIFKAKCIVRVIKSAIRKKQWRKWVIAAHRAGPNAKQIIVYYSSYSAHPTSCGANPAILY